MLKRLKSVFIVEDTSSQVNKSQTEKVPVKDVSSDEPINLDAPSSEKFVNSLLKAIETNNLEGFDYLEFKQSLKSLSNMKMEEATMFNSAYAMAQTMGATKKGLVDSANHYLDVLKTEESKFNDAYQKQQQKQVVSREEKLSALENSINKKEAQIKKLQEEIKNSKKQLEIKKKEIQQASAKVTQTRDQFLASHRKVADQIVSDIERMNKYLNT